jgi:signal transduction histidine kinase
MNLEMKQRCEKCLTPLAAEGEAYICSFECTYCAACTLKLKNICGHCGGELVRRPRRTSALPSSPPPDTVIPRIRPRLTWAASVGVWIFISLASTLTIYAMYHASSRSMRFGTDLAMQFGENLTFAPLTPLVLAFAWRFPVRKSNWRKRCLQHLGAGIAFSVVHVGLRSLCPDSYWDPVNREWSSALWNSHLHAFRDFPAVFRTMFLESVVDDITAVYIPIVIVAHLISYYKSFRERELRARQLEGQLAKARLQTLKSQLQPHFLFNTLHSISALMLTDVIAADRMMTSLSDLLRLTLENNGTQLTTLSRELEFLDVYLSIEKIRFEDRLSVFLDIAPVCLDAQVPHLLLQPLVENAVRHGISKRSSPGEIQIISRQEAGNLHLWIRDNGPGLCEAQDGTLKHGVGLRVTRERLIVLYGSDQCCQIENRPEGGAEVHLQFPFLPTDPAFAVPDAQIATPNPQERLA